MILISIIIGLLVLAVLVSYIAYRIAFYASADRTMDVYAMPPSEQYQKVSQKIQSLIKAMDELEYEQVYITAHDGTKLAARYYHVKDGAPLQIEIHGYRSSPLIDFCGGNKLARESGYNALAIDQRSHGKSGDSTITFGIKERYDCLDWIKYANERFGENTPIILAGVSMGAATVLMASELDLPDNVVGIIADCPYSSPEAIIRKVCKEDMKLPPKVVFPFVRLGAKIFGKFNMNESSAVSAVSRAKVPILLIHGEDDRFVPYEMSREIFESCKGEKRLELFEGAGHGLSYITGTEKYEKIVNEFIRKCVNKG